MITTLLGIKTAERIRAVKQRFMNKDVQNNIHYYRAVVLNLYVVMPMANLYPQKYFHHLSSQYQNSNYEASTKIISWLGIIRT